MTADPEGPIATVVWRAALDADTPISTEASRHIAVAVTNVLGDLPRYRRIPPLQRRVLEDVRYAAWTQRGLLAVELRRIADRLEAEAHQAMIDDAA